VADKPLWNYVKPTDAEKPVIRFLQDDGPVIAMPHVQERGKNVSTHAPGTVPGCPLCNPIIANLEACKEGTDA
jgi:hypothetical protein